MGLLYGLIAVGLALIFGLMDVVNFAHGEFLMIAMYATFCLFAFFAIDPVLAAPLVRRRCSCSARWSILVVRFAMRAKANVGMVQIFSTFGLAIVMRGLAQYLLHARLPQHHPFAGSAASHLDRRHLPAGAATPRRACVVAGASSRSISSSTAPISAARSKRRARMPAPSRWSASTRTGSSRSAGGSAPRWSGIAGAIMAIFFYIHPDVGASFALIAYVTVALGGFGSVFGAFAGGSSRRPGRGVHRPDPAAVDEIRRHLRGLSPGGFHAPARPVRIDLMDTAFAQRRRRDLIVAAVHCRSPLWCRCSLTMSMCRTSWS